MVRPAPLTEQQRLRVERHVDEVGKIAASVRRLLPHLDLDELESLGNEGLVNAARRYDPESGVSFGAFAHHRIRGAMIDGARRSQRAGRQAARAMRQLEASQALLEQASRDGTASELGSLRERVAAVRKLVERTSAAALMAHALPVEPDRVATEPEAERRLVSADLRARLGRSLHTLAPDDRKLIEAIYMEDRSMTALAEELGINKSTVSRRHNRILGELASSMNHRAPNS